MAVKGRRGLRPTRYRLNPPAESTPDRCTARRDARKLSAKPTARSPASAGPRAHPSSIVHRDACTRSAEVQRRVPNAVDAAMRAAIPSLERLADVLGLVRSHRIVSRSGRVGTYSYSVHGAGCRFVSDDGIEVDVDFASDGSEIFDLWRLRWYGLSLPEPLDVTDQDLRTAVRSLQPLLTEVRPGWFSVTR
ncbi:DUF6896 domain-containing protein [Streptomyces sp. enrichment culture]|uniref:DUF6896 domain-containing protein n=1 Tax=Streptomyces sp. enrichment culture TaxID=1795815 RepID=UPI003F573A67